MTHLSNGHTDDLTGYMSTVASTVALSSVELNLRDSDCQRTKRRDKRLIIYMIPTLRSPALRPCLFLKWKPLQRYNFFYYYKRKVVKNFNSKFLNALRWLEIWWIF